VPEWPLPPYAFVPGGRWPHPISDPRGHSFGRPQEQPEALTQANWSESRAYLHGIDLFNHGFFWEAHEAWESLWHAVGRAGPVADFLKGLIHLAAAGVKVGQRVPEGVRSHARRAAELFEQTEDRVKGSSYLGLEPARLIGACRTWEECPLTVDNPATAVPAVVEPLRIVTAADGASP
jgi:predicted metal-dependent hydrolase